MLRIALLVMLFVLLSADYSSLVSTVFTALGGTVVTSGSHRASTASASEGRKVPTAPGDLGTIRRSSDIVRADTAGQDKDDDNEDSDDVEDVFDFGGGSTAKLFSEYDYRDDPKYMDCEGCTFHAAQWHRLVFYF